MQDKLRYVLSVRTLIEMSLLRAARVATVASIEEVLRAVRELAGSGAGQRPATPRAGAQPAPQPPASPAAAPKPAASPAAVPQPAASPAAAPKPAAAPPPAAPTPELSAEERRKILDDDKVNDLLKTFPGAKITDLS